MLLCNDAKEFEITENLLVGVAAFSMYTLRASFPRFRCLKSNETEMLLSGHLKFQVTKDILELVVKSDGYMMSSGDMVELILSRDDSIRITQGVFKAAVPITQQYSLI